MQLEHSIEESDARLNRLHGTLVDRHIMPIIATTIAKKGARRRCLDPCLQLIRYVVFLEQIEIAADYVNLKEYVVSRGIS